MIQKQFFFIKSYFLFMTSSCLSLGAFLLYHYFRQESCGEMIITDASTLGLLFAIGSVYLLTTVGLFFKQNIARQIGLILATASLAWTPFLFLSFKEILSYGFFFKNTLCLGMILFLVFLPLIILHLLNQESIKELFTPIPEKLTLKFSFFRSRIQLKHSFILICLSIYFFVSMVWNILSLPDFIYKEMFIFGQVFRSFNAMIFTQCLIILGFMATAGVYKQAKLGWWAGFLFHLITALGLLLNIFLITPEQMQNMTQHLMFLSLELRDPSHLIQGYRLQMSLHLVGPIVLIIYFLLKKRLFINPFIEWKKKQ